MTIGLSSLPPSALTKKATSLLYFFPSFHFFPFCARSLERSALKKTTFFVHIPYIFQLVHNSLSRSIQEPTVTSDTSKDSPDICFLRMT